MLLNIECFKFFPLTKVSGLQKTIHRVSINSSKNHFKRKRYFFSRILEDIFGIFDIFDIVVWALTAENEDAFCGGVADAGEFLSGANKNLYKYIL